MKELRSRSRQLGAEEVEEVYERTLTAGAKIRYSKNCERVAMQQATAKSKGGLIATNCVQCGNALLVHSASPEVRDGLCQLCADGLG